MPFPRGKKTAFLTPEVLRNMPASKDGSQGIYDSSAPLLLANKFSHHNGKVALGARYGKFGLVVDGKFRKRELFGLWPDMDLSDARSIAAERTKMIAEQRKRPIAADPLRRDTKRAVNIIKRTRPVEAPEAILLEPGVPADIDRDRYENLMLVMMDAVERASSGKGKERHESGEMFEDQAMAKIMDRTSDDFALGQAIKKLVESKRLPWDKARLERLDAMVYIAGSILWRDQK